MKQAGRLRYVALFITEGNIELDLIGGTTTAFVENLSESDINLTGSQGDIVLSVLSDNYQEGEYSLKAGSCSEATRSCRYFSKILIILKVILLSMMCSQTRCRFF